MRTLEKNSLISEGRHIETESHHRRPRRFLAVGLGAAFVFVAGGVRAAQPDAATEIANFTDRYCSSCHNDVDKEGGFDLTALDFAPADATNLLTWVKIHDRVQKG